MKKLKIVLVIITLSLLAWVSYITYPQTNTEAVQQTKVYQTVTVSELHELVNLERSKAGLQPLVLDERLNKSAQEKADDMVTDGYLAHIDPVTGQAGTKYIFKNMPECRVGSENLSYEWTDVSGVVRGWMGSKAHREAILNSSFTYVGYGIAGNNNTVVQHFC